MNGKNGKIIPVVSTKGSVGKTSLVIHIAGYLASRGKKILLIDADSQQSLGRFFDYKLELGVFVVDGFGRWLTGDAATEGVIRNTANHDNIDVIINDDPDKLGIPNFLRNNPGAVFKLGHLLKPLRQQYDYIFLDTEGTDGRDHNGNSVQHAVLFSYPDLVLSVTKTKNLFTSEILRTIDVYRFALKAYANIGQADFHAPLRFIVNEHDYNLASSQGELENIHSLIAEEIKMRGTDVQAMRTVVPVKRKFFESAFKERIFAHDYQDPNVTHHINKVIADLCHELFPGLEQEVKL